MSTIREQVEDRIVANAGALGVNFVGGEAHLSAIKEGSAAGIILPAVFIWRNKQKGEPRTLLGSVQQKMQQRIVVTIVTDNALSTSASSADSAEGISGTIWTLLAGWQPTGRRIDILYEAGELADIDTGLYYWNDYYNITDLGL